MKLLARVFVLFGIVGLFAIGAMLYQKHQVDIANARTSNSALAGLTEGVDETFKELQYYSQINAKVDAAATKLKKNYDHLAATPQGMRQFIGKNLPEFKRQINVELKLQTPERQLLNRQIGNLENLVALRLTRLVVTLDVDSRAESWIPRRIQIRRPLLSSSHRKPGPRAKHVFVISFDGGKPSVMQQSKMPTLFDMKGNGAGTWNARTIFPSITLPSHTSMLTGVSPAKHKIMWNSWLPEKGVVKVPTVFQLAHDRKLSTSMFVRADMFLHLVIPGTIDEFSLVNSHAIKAAGAIAKHIIEDKPNLCFIHFLDSDKAGHRYGWGSREQMISFNFEDKALKIVKDAVEKAGITNTSVIIMTADHGGHARAHGNNSREDMTIPWIAWGGPVKPGFTVSKQINTYDTAATVLWLLDIPIPKDWDGKPVKSAFK